MEQNEVMTYEQTAQLEQNVKIKNQADQIYKDFLNNIHLSPKNYHGNGRFLFWKDAHNATYFQIDSNGNFEYQCRFLHETYNVTVTPSAIFSAIKNKNRGIDHLASDVKRDANQK